MRVSLGCTLTVFDAHEQAQTLESVIRGEVEYPEWMQKDVRELIEALLQKSPAARLGSSPDGAASIMVHGAFASIDWEALQKKNLPAPFAPSELVDDADEELSVEGVARAALEELESEWPHQVESNVGIPIPNRASLGLPAFAEG